MVQRLKTRDRLKHFFLKDLNYKVLSFVAALLLWLMVLGRKDLTISKKLDLQFLNGANLEVVNPSTRWVDLELSGPRVALKKFSQSGQVYMLDLTSLKAGSHLVPLTKEGVSLPVGVRVVAVRPDQMRLKLKAIDEETP